MQKLKVESSRLIKTETWIKFKYLNQKFWERIKVNKSLSNYNLNPKLRWWWIMLPEASFYSEDSHHSLSKFL